MVTLAAQRWLQYSQPATTMVRLFAISDLHVDHKENLAFIKSWSDTNYKNDVLIVAGDVTDKLSLLETTLAQIKLKFREVFYVPGELIMFLYS